MKKCLVVNDDDVFEWVNQLHIKVDHTKIITFLIKKIIQYYHRLQV